MADLALRLAGVSSHASYGQPLDSDQVDVLLSAETELIRLAAAIDRAIQALREVEAHDPADRRMAGEIHARLCEVADDLAKAREAGQ
jgi:hypothetical protein